MGTRALIGLGSNVGDRQAHLDAAVSGLREVPGVVVLAVSPYLETAPIGGPPRQGDYLNAAASVDTTLAPIELLHRLHSLEQQAGRVRTVRWGERPLDLDLLLFGDRIIDSGPASPSSPVSDALTVPHPRMALRRFVLAPLAEIAPDAIDPVTGRSVADLLANLDRRPSLVAVTDSAGLFAPELVRRLVEEFSAIEVRGDQASRWCEAAHPSERWLVTSFDPDAGLMGQFTATDTARSLVPTFIVAPLVTRGTMVGQPWGTYHPGGRGPSASGPGSEDGPRPPVGKRNGGNSIAGVPVLEAPSGDPDAIFAEVIAACAATRVGR